LILFHRGHTKKLSLLDAKNKNGKPLIPVEQKNPINDCPDCLARRHCETLQNQANYEVRKALQRFEKSYIFDWMNGSNQLIKTRDVLRAKVVIPDQLKNDPGYKEIMQQLKLNVMDLPSVVANIDDNELKLLKDKLVGGFYPESYEMPKSKIVGFAPRSTIGVLKWQFSNNVYNYAIIDKVNIDDTTIVEYGRIANREKISGCRFMPLHWMNAMIQPASVLQQKILLAFILLPQKDMVLLIQAQTQETNRVLMWPLNQDKILMGKNYHATKKEMF
jgi:hypothetical protein